MAAYGRLAGHKQVADTSGGTTSTRSVAVPEAHSWKVTGIYATLTSSATAGSRRIGVKILDANLDVVQIYAAPLVQAGSLVYSYQFAAGLPRETAVVDLCVLQPLAADLMLDENWRVQIYDRAEIDAEGDNATLVVTYTDFIE